MHKLFFSGFCFFLVGCSAGDDTAGDTGEPCSASAPSVSPDVLPVGSVGAAYSQQLTAVIAAMRQAAPLPTVDPLPSREELARMKS